MKVYILKTQNNLVLNKNFEWSSEPHRDSVFSSLHRDIALNQLIELNAKDINLRAQIIECEADKKGRPVLLLEASAIQSSTPANVDQTNAA